ncbi:MAG: protein kinase [Burkholderiales bacterium]
MATTIGSPDPSISVLIIDDSEDMRLLVRHYVLVEWPRAKIEDWDPIDRGKPGKDFPWRSYDVVLLDYMLGTEDGLIWLKEFRRNSDCPPVIFMTGQGSEDVAVKALKAGAHDYLRKHDLSQAKLVGSMRDAIAQIAFAPPKLVFDLPDLPVIEHTDEFEVEHESIRASIDAYDRTGITQQPVRIFGYAVLRKIGAGGMSSVYLAEREPDRALTVLKLLNADLSRENEFLRRFIREYGILSKLSSPYVVKIFDQGYTDRHVYIAMEYFAGGDLKACIDRGIEPHHAISLLSQMARGLQAIHTAEVIHRDLKPQNIMFRADGSLGILDFGIAKMASTETQLTEHGQVFGTPFYMSPEQGTGKILDARSDLYSLGVIFYEMLTGKRLYSADNAVALVYKHLHDKIPILPRHLADYQELLNRAVAKAPGDRFATAGSLLGYLDRRFGK